MPDVPPQEHAPESEDLAPPPFAPRQRPWQNAPAHPEPGAPPDDPQGSGAQPPPNEPEPAPPNPWGGFPPRQEPEPTRAASDGDPAAEPGGPWRHSPFGESGAAPPSPAPTPPVDGTPAVPDPWVPFSPASSRAGESAAGELSFPLSTNPSAPVGPIGAWPGNGGMPPFGGETVALPGPAERHRGRSFGRLLREVAETVILALLIFLFVRAVVQNFQVEGSSMEPTLHDGLYLLVNKAAYWEINLDTLGKFIPFIDPGDDPTRFIFGGPSRGDVIVFKAPDQVAGTPERDFIKRVIGLPGDTVEVRDCTVFINGKPLDEPYIQEAPTGTFAAETVPPDHYFVLGDNRNNSRDSRVFGMLDKDLIIGKAWITYWPFDNLGFVDDTSVEPGEPSGATPKVTSPACAAGG